MVRASAGLALLSVAACAPAPPLNTIRSDTMGTTFTVKYAHRARMTRVRSSIR